MTTPNLALNWLGRSLEALAPVLRALASDIRRTDWPGPLPPPTPADLHQAATTMERLAAAMRVTRRTS